jgi:hypothetical protein
VNGVVADADHAAAVDGAALDKAPMQVAKRLQGKVRRIVPPTVKSMVHLRAAKPTRTGLPSRRRLPSRELPARSLPVRTARRRDAKALRHRLDRAPVSDADEAAGDAVATEAGLEPEREMACPSPVKD